MSIEKNNKAARFRFQVTILTRFDDPVGLGPISRDPDPKDHNFGVTNKFARYGLHRSIKKIINALEFGSRNAEVGKMDRGQIFKVGNRNSLCPMPRN